jgi:hypothetical protein
VIRAKVRRDGPGEWSWVLVDDHCDLIVGVTDSWEQALADVRLELAAFERDLEREQDDAAVVVGGRWVTPRYDWRPAWKRWLGL